MYRNRKWLVAFTILFRLGSDCYAQDPNFSQYFASPLSLNPANTGFFDGDYRIAFNTRQQWWNVGQPYTTASASVDTRIPLKGLAEGDRLGIGFMGLADESLGGALKSGYVSASGSYHKRLARNGAHNLGIGIQVTYTNRNFDYSKLTFASQYNGRIFDPTLPADATFNATSVNHLDLNLGLLYSGYRDWGNYFAGLSVYHLSKPVETLFNEAGDAVPYRTTFHAGGTLRATDNSNWIVSGIYMNQGTASDQMIGTAYEMSSNSEKRPISLYVGFWYRFSQSYIPYIGLEYGNVMAGLNYGITTTKSAFKPRTVELSLIFRKRSFTNQAGICPKF